jgi:hypothetical protein
MYIMTLEMEHDTVLAEKTPVNGRYSASEPVPVDDLEF